MRRLMSAAATGKNRDLTAPRQGAARSDPDDNVLVPQQSLTAGSDRPKPSSISRIDLLRGSLMSFFISVPLRSIFDVDDRKYFLPIGPATDPADA